MKKFHGLLLLLTFVSVLSCSKSGRRRSMMNDTAVSETSENISRNTHQTIVKMTRINGVYEIPTEVNGVQMHFIFDTGAGMISMSGAEAIFLYKQGKLSEADAVGNADFIDANGNISEGLVINLKEVKVGDKILRNIKASVVPNLKAPLLFGQSALEKFGKISIDYNNEQITFE